MLWKCRDGRCRHMPPMMWRKATSLNFFLKPPEFSGRVRASAPENHRRVYAPTYFLVPLPSIDPGLFPGVIKVVVSRCEWRQPDNCEDGRLSRNQLQWWRESGQKKFPRVQLVEDRNEADWILFWSDSFSTYKTQATATTIHN